MKKLLLHVCCAPCSTYVIELLKSEYDITLFFYNPNIHPLSEQKFREKEVVSYAKKNNLPIIIETGNLKDWFMMIKDVMWEKERTGVRCSYCYKDRLETSAFRAKKDGFDFFATTLSVSPYKLSKNINEIGERLSREIGIDYLVSDFKKKNGYKRSIEISNQEGMYRQDYCGCVFSKLERLRIKPYNK